MSKKKSTYGLGKTSARKPFVAPTLPYEPRDPKKYHPAIAFIGCGGITQAHLRGYKHAGYHVAAFCDRDIARAEARRKEHYPKAKTYSDYHELLRDDNIEVVDIATHPDVRAPIIRDALNAGKHVLSQKPFVLDLDTGARLADLADKKGLRLAVNQNGRWAPHFSYMRAVVAAGVIGRVNAAHLAVSWNHNWIKTSHFDKVRHIVLYDFAIHWFDILSCFMGETPCTRVYASFTRTPTQTATPALLGQALLEFEGAQATLTFDADTATGQWDTTFLAGSKGSLRSEGRDLSNQKVILSTEKGQASPKLRGTWFREGFHGTMAELLCAIEEKREPTNSARNNLRGLALCFAAVVSAEKGKPMVPGKVKRLLHPKA